MKILTIIRNFFFPPRCVFCDSVMELNEVSEICGGCSSRIKFCEESPCCEKCGKPIASFGKRQLCYFCIEAGERNYERIVSVFEYDGVVKESIIRYKELELPGYAKVYANCLASRIALEYGNVKFDFICGMPPHKRSVSGNGDRIARICRINSKQLNIPFKANVFIRNRKTAKQSSLGFEERQENLKNSMSVLTSVKVEGKTILLVDDVCTTRASIEECSRALREAGANAVYAATVATVRRKEYSFNEVKISG